MKKMTIPLLLVSSVSIAGTMGPVASQPEYSFFIGGAAGIGAVSGHFAGTSPLANGALDIHGSKPSGNSFLGGALLGVQKYCDNDIYAALVGNVLYNSYDSQIRLSTSATTGVTTMGVHLKNDFQYGLNVRLGKRFGTATPYFLAGVEVGKWDMTLVNNSATSGRGILANSSSTFGKSKAGFQGGFGTLISLNENVNFGMEYAHTWFENISNYGSLPSQNYTHTAKIEQDQVLFSLNYLFNA